MTQLPDTLAALARGIGQFLRLPTAFLLTWASVILVILGLQLWALLVPPGGPGAVGTLVLLVVLALLVVPVAMLAIRRRRWLRRSAQRAAGGTPVVVGSTGTSDLVTIDALGDRIEDQMSGLDGEADVRAVMDAFTEAQLPPTDQRSSGARLTRLFGIGRLSVIGRVFGRMERAQRALMTAAGGPTQAPYLVDDLRITVAAFAGTVVTIVVGGLGIIVLAIVLLTR